MTPETRQKLRRLLVPICFVIVHVLLDRSTISFQIWTEISAWYPPTGLAFAVLLGFGPRYALPIMIACDIASIVNYHLPVYSFSFLVGNVEFTAVYAAAALLLRRGIKIDLHLRSLRDVSRLLLVATLSSCVVAFLGTEFLVLDHLIPSRDYLRATFNWWVGDAVAIGSLTPFCLIYVLPGIRRFAGYSEPAGTVEDRALIAVNRHESQGVRRAMESGLFAVCIICLLYTSYEALAAIEQRLLSSIEAGSDECREIENAQRGLLTLKAERVDYGQRSPDHRLPADDLRAGDGVVSRHWAAN